MTRRAARGVDAVVASDVLVVGSGLAGLTVALGLGDREVTLVTRGALGRDGASAMAQGGIAAAVGEGDAPAAHASDTLAVGGDLNDAAAVRLLTTEAPAAIRRLAALGTRFDRDGDGRLRLGREAAHRRARIVHARGDGTGAEVSGALATALRRAGGARCAEGARLEELVRERGRVVGALVRRDDGSRELHLAPAVVLATGGLGRLWAHTTNPPTAAGDGLAAAARAGAWLADLEFVQFHPTALAAAADPMPLLTEALRGAGASIVDGAGRRFLADVDPRAELAPRDVVARAVWERRAAGDEVLLDARAVGSDGFARRFPTVFAAAAAVGLDPRRQPLPIAAAAHYHMGGVAVDGRGRASLPGLWACGEVACTGVHGANRLASNSLLEALVFGARVAADVAAALPELPPAKALLAPPGVPAAGEDAAADPAVEAVLRRLMWERVGVVRNGDGLAAALAELAALAAGLPPGARELGGRLLVARLIAHAALTRDESRGAHFRRDAPASHAAWRCRLALRLAGGEAGELELRRQPVAAAADAGQGAW